MVVADFCCGADSWSNFMRISSSPLYSVRCEMARIKIVHLLRAYAGSVLGHVYRVSGL